MNLIPPRRQIPFKPSGKISFHPASVLDSNPAMRDIVPEPKPAERQCAREEPSPAVSGYLRQVPDGWIPRPQAQERLLLAGIDLDSRRIRHLCARNDLENTKVRNEKNQPQYFISPASLEKYIEKMRPENLTGTAPDHSALYPGKEPDQKFKSVEVIDPAASGQHDVNTALKGQGTNTSSHAELARLREEIKGKDVLIDELRNEKADMRLDLKTTRAAILSLSVSQSLRRHQADRRRDVGNLEDHSTWRAPGRTKNRCIKRTTNARGYQLIRGRGDPTTFQ